MLFISEVQTADIGTLPPAAETRIFAGVLGDSRPRPRGSRQGGSQRSSNPDAVHIHLMCRRGTKALWLIRHCAVQTEGTVTLLSALLATAVRSPHFIDACFTILRFHTFLPNYINWVFSFVDLEPLEIEDGLTKMRIRENTLVTAHHYQLQCSAK